MRPDAPLVDSRHFRLTVRGLEVTGQPAVGDWRAFGETARTLGASAEWGLADWLAFGDDGRDWTAQEAAELLAMSPGSILRLVRVAERYPPGARVLALSQRHHLVVSLEDDRAALLAQAAAERWPVERLEEIIRERRYASRTTERKWPEGRYGLIYCDPPWHHQEGAVDPSRRAERQYPTLTVDQLCGMAPRIDNLRAPDCVLMLWATAPKMAEAVDLIRSWDFVVTSGSVWVKDLLGLGSWFRQRHELLVLATHGHPACPLEAARPDSVIDAPRTEHSRKPARVYELLEQMFPGVPKVELFARPPFREGWATWGDVEAAACPIEPERAEVF